MSKLYLGISNRLIAAGLLGCIAVLLGEKYLLNPLNSEFDWSNIPYYAIHYAIDLLLIALAAVLAFALTNTFGRLSHFALPRYLGLLSSACAVFGFFLFLIFVSFLLRGWLHPFVDSMWADLTGSSLPPWICATTIVTQDIESANPNLNDWFLVLQRAWFGAQIDAAIFTIVVLSTTMLPALLTQIGDIATGWGRGLAAIRLDGPSLNKALGGRRLPVGVVVLGCGFLLFQFAFTDADRSVESSALAHASSTNSNARQPNDEQTDPCNDPSKKKRKYNVSAINVEIVLNRFGDRDPFGYMYTLDNNVDAIRKSQTKLGCTRWNTASDPQDKHVPCVSTGLRNDLIQPLILRARLGECVQIKFTNRLVKLGELDEAGNQSWPIGKSLTDNKTPNAKRLEGGTPPPDDDRASLTIHGLAHWSRKSNGPAGGSVGRNRDTFAKRGESVVYEISLPTNPTAERAYYFHDGGGNRQRIARGLFGALIVEPEGTRFLNPEDGKPSDGTGWHAIIQCPPQEPKCITADGEKTKDFREFALIYHEVGDENNALIMNGVAPHSRENIPVITSQRPGGSLPQLGDVYRSSGRAINYRSEPFLNRLTIKREKPGLASEDYRTKKSLAYSSYTFGDPATPIPRSYMGEPTKTRLIHGGTEVFHVHHLHGGAIRWRRNPKSDPFNDVSSGLSKIPVQKAFSTRLDSQTIGPGTSFNLMHECGSGGCQQAAGDFLFHCHIGQHYVAGMWSFWRVYDTKQHDLFVLPDREDPPKAITSEQLIDRTLSNGKQVVATAADITDPAKQIVLKDWVARQLPPQKTTTSSGGAASPIPRGEDDATFWDWTWSSQNSLVALSEKETESKWVNYDPKLNAGERHPIKFNESNGRPAWPLMRPHLGQRPPFSPNGHKGTAWLPEKVSNEQPDGLCPADAPVRHYPISAVPIDIRKTFRFPGDAKKDLWITSKGNQAFDGDGGELFVLNENILPTVRSENQKNFRVQLRSRGGQCDTETSKDNTRKCRAYQQSVQPLAIRSSVGDCVKIILTSRLNVTSSDKVPKVNIHTHFVQFDPQSSDGVITGYSYEQSVKPYWTERRWLVEPAAAGDDEITVNHVDGLREGIAIGIGLGEGMCIPKTDAGGEFECDPDKVANAGPIAGARPLTEIRTIKKLLPCASPNKCKISLDKKLMFDHRSEKNLGQRSTSEAVGVEFVQYTWYSDVDSGTVFWHDHVDFNSWDRGLIGAHVIEPPGATWRDPSTGREVRSGTIVDVHDELIAQCLKNGGMSIGDCFVEKCVRENIELNRKQCEKNPDRSRRISVGAGQIGSFREFVLFNHRRHSLIQGTGTREASINLKAEPVKGPAGFHEFFKVTQLPNGTSYFGRDGEPAHWFSSVVHGDPFTPLPRAYAGDPFVIRQVGVQDRVGGIRVTGHRFRLERWAGPNALRGSVQAISQGSYQDTSPAGISERYDLILDGGAGGPMRLAGDYLYYNSIGRDFLGGAWGLIRVHPATANANPTLEETLGLKALPERRTIERAKDNVEFAKNVPLTDGLYLKWLVAPEKQPALKAAADDQTDKQVCPFDSKDEKYDIAISEAHIVLRAIKPEGKSDATDERVIPIAARNAVTYSVNRNQIGIPVVFSPVVLRVSRGDCLTVKLTNNLKPLSEITSSRDCVRSGQGKPWREHCRSRIPAGHAGLTVGELLFDPQKSYGLAVGLNSDSSVAPRSSRVFRYYADRELGMVVALNLANPALAAKGAFAGVVVEPASSKFWDIKEDRENKTGIAARIISARDGRLLFNEVVTIFNGNDHVIGHNRMPYPRTAGCLDPAEFATGHKYTTCAHRSKHDAGRPYFTSISFRSHPWLQQVSNPDDASSGPNDFNEFEHVPGRNYKSRPSYVFSTLARDHPQHDVLSPVLLETEAGAPVVFRVSLPWDEQVRVFSMEGHRWFLEPTMIGSEEVFSRNLVPGLSFDAALIGGAGGIYKKHGDYLVLDNRLAFAKAGAWGILRVNEPKE